MSQELIDQTSGQSFVTARLDGAIGNLTFSNPGKHNALPQVAWEAVPLAVSRLCEAGARVIVANGEGPSFCAGADISEFDVVRKNAETARIYEQSNIDAFAALRDAPVPVIAKIKGFCLGGGFGLAAACDIRLADKEARFAVPAAKLGLGYPVEAMADIVHAVGAQHAKLLLFTARRLHADELKTMGFLLGVLEGNALDDAVDALVQEITELAPLTHKATKASIAAAQGGDQALADQLGSGTFMSKDYAEGRAAFKEKRKPKFIGA